MTNAPLQQYFATLARSNPIVCSSNTTLVSDNARIAHSDPKSTGRQKGQSKPNRWDCSGCRTLQNSPLVQVFSTVSQDFTMRRETPLSKHGMSRKAAPRRSNSHPPSGETDTLCKDTPMKHPLRVLPNKEMEQFRRGRWDSQKQSSHFSRCLPPLSPASFHLSLTPHPIRKCANVTGTKIPKEKALCQNTGLKGYLQQR